jgi:hypothetical protein
LVAKNQQFAVFLRDEGAGGPKAALHDAVDLHSSQKNPWHRRGADPAPLAGHRAPHPTSDIADEAGRSGSSKVTRYLDSAGANR